jgi:AraC-like DNA-binding protein
MRAFAKDFYLDPLIENKSLIDCSCKVILKKERTKVDFHKINLGRANLLHWDYHADEVKADTPAHCVYHKKGCMSQAVGMLVSLNGPIVTVSDGHNIGGSFSRFHLFSPKESLQQRWGKDARVLLLTLPLSLCNELLTQSGMTSSDSEIDLAPGISLPLHAKPLIANIINNLTYCYERESLGFPFQSMWSQQVEKLTAIFFLQHLHSSFSNHAGKYQDYCDDSYVPKPLSGLEKLEDYLLKHLSAPISLDDMVKVSGYSRSYLHKLCLKYMGASPTIWLRNLRLDAVDKHLRTKPGMSITEVALLYGFGHMGRFSHYFYQRFGHHPSSLKHEGYKHAIKNHAANDCALPDRL